MTDKEREKWFCEQCKYHDTCGWRKIGSISRCLDIQESMYGLELGQKDTIEVIKNELRSASDGYAKLSDESKEESMKEHYFDKSQTYKEAILCIDGLFEQKKEE